MPDDADRPTPPNEDEPRAEAPPIWDATILFGSAREVWIEHHGERYRLRITRRGRLILTK